MDINKNGNEKEMKESKDLLISRCQENEKKV